MPSALPLVMFERATGFYTRFAAAVRKPGGGHELAYATYKSDKPLEPADVETLRTSPPFPVLTGVDACGA